MPGHLGLKLLGVGVSVRRTTPVEAVELLDATLTGTGIDMGALRALVGVG